MNKLVQYEDRDSAPGEPESGPERRLSRELEHAHDRLLDWCGARDFAGHDPFDGLNSRIFQATPLRHSRLARLAWTQFFKRSPLNLRGLALVPAGRNPKGTALFALAALSRFRARRSAEDERLARSLLSDLLAARLKGCSGAAWGYNFDWQGRAFFAPKGTPTIVPTAFAARALIEASLEFDEKSYLEAARAACEFILRDLHRTAETEEEVCWSYSPLDRTRVFNASLLAAETLSTVAALTGEQHLREQALSGARYVVRRQREDGSWSYGAEDFQSWADNFHTAFVLSSLSSIMARSAEARDEFTGPLKRGYKFWRETFFLADGCAKYYHDGLYPIDAHSAGAGIVTLLEMQWVDDAALDWAHRVAGWAIRNLCAPGGFFYYQRRRFYTVRIPYMRWAQAWMLYALARLMEEREKKGKEAQSLKGCGHG